VNSSAPIKTVRIHPEMSRDELNCLLTIMAWQLPQLPLFFSSPHRNSDQHIAGFHIRYSGEDGTVLSRLTDEMFASLQKAKGQPDRACFVHRQWVKPGHLLIFIRFGRKDDPHGRFCLFDVTGPFQSARHAPLTEAGQFFRFLLLYVEQAAGLKPTTFANTFKEL
jgi:hypothetical protein